MSRAITDPRPRPRRRLRLAAAAGIAALASAVLTACGGSTAATGDSGAAGAGELRLGYFPNLTHAVAVLGVADGQYAKALGSTKLTTQTFNAGPAAIEALLSGSIDATYIGPNPALNGYIKSKGEALRIVAGAASGGASFVVQPDVTEDNLKGRTFASPQLGGTQDVALRNWLKGKGLSAPKTGEGDVSVAPTENATTLDLFKKKEIDGAWVPEPWATRLVLEGGGKVLVDERDLWPDKKFVTTHLIVSKKFLDANPEVVRNLIKGQLAAEAAVAADEKGSLAKINAAIKDLTGKPIKDEVLAAAWPNLEVTNDPVATSLKTDVDHAVAVGLTDPADINGIYDLRILNEELKAAGKPAVSAGGLGSE